MRRIRNAYLAALAVLLSPLAANADLISENLGSSAYSASSVWGESYTADLAFDGDLETNWNAGVHPVAWIEVNLGQLFDIAQIDLLTDQLPDGDTTHEIWLSSSAMGSDLSSATLAYTFSGFTGTEQWLSGQLSSSITAQYVQVRTTSSPSWVAWHEIQVHDVPEPATLALFGLGLAGIGFSRRKKA